jgi:hypothetical protein
MLAPRSSFPLALITFGAGAKHSQQICAVGANCAPQLMHFTSFAGAPPEFIALLLFMGDIDRRFN